jgi:predicted glutamine amidotransferase
MCIGIAKPKEVILTKSVLHHCYIQNPDGCGFAYPSDDGKSVVVNRGYFSFEKFWKAFRDLQDNRPMLIHFRIGTSGGIDKLNCHPFLIDKKHALIHNGNIESKLDEKIDGASDTATFVQTVLCPIFSDKKFKKTNFWTTDSFQWLMEKSLGYNNKMAILSADGTIKIYNESQGEKDHEVWFSNKSYKEERKNLKGAKVEIIRENGWIKERTTYNSGKTSEKLICLIDKFEENELGTTITEADILSAEEREEVARELDDSQRSNISEGEARLAAFM